MEADQNSTKNLEKKLTRSRKLLILLMLLLGGSQAVALGLLAVCESEPREQVRMEMLGLQYLMPLRRLEEHLLLYPDKLAQAAGGGDTERESLLLHEQEIDSLLGQLENIDHLHGGRLHSTEDLVHLLEVWKQLRKARGRPEEAVALHRQLDRQVRSMIGLVGDTSDLILDPKIETYYLIDSMVNRLEQGSQLLGAVRQLQGADGCIADEREESFLSRELQRTLQETARNYHVSLEKEESLRSPLEKPLRIYESRLVSLISFLDGCSRPGGWEQEKRSDLVDGALAANSQLFARTLPEVERLLESRLQDLEDRRVRRMASLVPFLVAGLLPAAWGLREEIQPGESAASPPAENVQHENEQLKLLVAELALSNRNLQRQISRPMP